MAAGLYIVFSGYRGLTRLLESKNSWIVDSYTSSAKTSDRCALSVNERGDLSDRKLTSVSPTALADNFIPHFLRSLRGIPINLQTIHGSHSILRRNKTKYGSVFRLRSLRQTLLRFDRLCALAPAHPLANDPPVVIVLLLNAVSILSEDRFLARSVLDMCVSSRGYADFCSRLG